LKGIVEAVLSLVTEDRIKRKEKNWESRDVREKEQKRG
jgi:hypothetical protein